MGFELQICCIIQTSLLPILLSVFKQIFTSWDLLQTEIKSQISFNQINNWKFFLCRLDYWHDAVLNGNIKLYVLECFYRIIILIYMYEASSKDLVYSILKIDDRAINSIFLLIRDIILLWRY